jgi:hypothetical protein
MYQVRKTTYGKREETVRQHETYKRTLTGPEIIQMGSEAGVIVRSGAYYKYQDATIGQGIENARQL